MGRVSFTLAALTMLAGAVVAELGTAGPGVAADSPAPPTAVSAPSVSATPASASPPPASVRAKDPDDQGWAEDKSLRGAVTAPLHDINLIRAKIPDILLDAMDAPYARNGPMTCEAIAAEVIELDAVLGPDLDQPYSPDRPGLLQRGQSTAAMAVKAGSEYFIPGIGFIKYLSGAERHEAVVRAAIEAGAVRRGFLKGLGVSAGCQPPGAPLPAALDAIPGASRALAHKARAAKTKTH